jgi:hypothetical protein
MISNQPVRAGEPGKFNVCKNLIKAKTNLPKLRSHTTLNTTWKSGFMNSNHNSTQIEIHWAPRKLGALIFIGAACVAVAYFLTRTWSIELIAAIVFSLVAMPALMVISSDKRPCIIISNDGFFDRRLKTGVIPWPDIKALSVTNVHGSKCIGFQFYDEHKYLGHVSWLTRMCAYIIRMPAINTTANGTEIGFDDLYRLISDRHERFKLH